MLRLGFQWAGWPEAARPRLERVTPELELLVLPEVFPPSRCFTTRALVEALGDLPLSQDMVALDMGTGTGAAAVALARRGLRVDAVDLNPSAVRCARANALLHGVDGRLEVLEGDLFAPVAARRYDLIVFNPPYFDGSPTRWLDHAFYGGEGGEVIDRFLREAPAHLTARGQVLLSWSTLANTPRLDRQIAAAGLAGREVHRRDVVTEVITHRLLTRAA